jgi:predicted ABC-type ATPase
VGESVAAGIKNEKGPPFRLAGLFSFPPVVCSLVVSPSVYIIARPNGAGKTTFAQRFLPRYADCKNFINADLIALGLSPFAPEAAAFSAGRLMLEEIERFANRGDDFGFETTLSGTTYLQLIRRLRARSYAVHILFLWLPEVELSLSRIRDRVLEGGHNVPEPIVRRRYERSIKNFLQVYRSKADFWTLFDNSGSAPATIALEKQGQLRIIEGELYGDLIRRYGAL